ncbi:hypothetical protein ACFWWC_26670 [Streptomyces sp. NPDC058642]|uniref:hypothetical protein n=1 Tax=Streptomyces sp. NPDC058642 TaxID=3346572 RepID=UPI003655909B
MPGRQRGRGRPRKALDGADLGPERLAFVEALRTVFFDRLKDEGVTYADISRRLGTDYSPTTLSRIASGRKLPEYDQLVALVALVPHLAGQPLTEKAEQHLWQLYLRAVGAKNPAHVPYYQYLRDIAGVRERQQAMVAIRTLHPLPANGEDDDPDADHPAVQLRDDAAALLHEVARAGIPLPPQPLVTPPPGASRPPAVDALLEQTTWLLDQTDQALRRHLAPLESDGFVSAEETDPAPPEPAGVPQLAPSLSGPLWDPAPPPRAGHLHAQIWSVVLAAVCVVLAVGYLLERLPLQRGDDPRAGASSAATSPQPGPDPGRQPS